MVAFTVFVSVIEALISGIVGSVRVITAFATHPGVVAFTAFISVIATIISGIVAFTAFISVIATLISGIVGSVLVITAFATVVAFTLAIFIFGGAVNDAIIIDISVSVVSA